MQTPTPPRFGPELTEAYAAAHIRKRFAAGSVLLEPRSRIRSFPIVVAGAVGVYRPAPESALRGVPEGNGLLLYYLRPGETCAATLASCLGSPSTGVRIVVEVDAEVDFLPAEQVERWMAMFPEWRAFVLRGFHERFERVLASLDSLAFRDLRSRTLDLLTERTTLVGSRWVSVTHRELASNLYSTRTVVSRVLKGLERDGALRLHRGAVEVLASPQGAS